MILGSSFVAVLVLVAIFGRLWSPQATGDDPAASAGPATPDPAQTSTAGSDGSTSRSNEPTDQPATEAGDSVGFTRDKLGARAAAVAYLEATEDVVQMAPVDAAAAQRAISTEAAADRLGQRVEDQMVDLVAQAPQGIDVWVAPIGARSVEIDGGFEVSIWYAEVIAIGTDSTLDNWRTVTYSLRWERNTWLIDDSVSAVGPVPTRSHGLTVTAPATLVSTLGFFDDEGLTP